MGEARRRKAKVDDFGKYHDLSTIKIREKHLDSLLSELFAKFTSDISTLILAEDTPDNFQDICDRLRAWLDNKLINYRESDRDDLIKCLLLLFGHLHSNYGLEKSDGSGQRRINSYLFDCIFAVTKDFLSPDSQATIKHNMQENLATCPVPAKAIEWIGGLS